MRVHIRNIDRRAALLAGYEVGEHPAIEMNLAELGDDRATVIDRLVIQQDGSGVYAGEALTAPTVEALIAACKATAARDAAAKAAWIARCVAATAAYETAEPLPLSKPLYSDTFDKLGTYDGFVTSEYQVDQVSIYDSSWSASPEKRLELPEYRAMDAAREALRERCKAADAAAKAAALPGLIAAKEAEKAAWEAGRATREAEAAVRKATADAELAARFAARLESGYWERETDSYNERKEGKPWCARVTGIDKGKLIYEWGEWTGHVGGAGLLRLTCAPGDIIAWGQKDLRRPGRSEHHLQIMRDDGRMIEITPVEAARTLRGAGK